MLGACAMLLTTLTNVRAQDGFVSVPASAFKVVERQPSTTRLAAVVEADAPFDEVVPSWSADAPAGSRVVVYLKPGAKPNRYCLGMWSATEGRTSIKGQSDDVGSVDTDTLTLKEPVKELTVEVVLEGPADPRLRIGALRLSLVDTMSSVVSREPLKAVWGSALEPPRRAQASYPNGGGACSPTSVSMLLGYWAATLKTPQIDHDVPEVQSGVYDVAWKGTGNWPFNMAYAASQPGLNAYVSRFRDVRDLEEWVAADVPVAASVSYAMLKGKPEKEPNDGHLVVVVGFDANGDPVFNDPGREAVRTTYKRADFERAWGASRRTVYLVYPKLWRVPTGPGPWEHAQPRILG